MVVDESNSFNNDYISPVILAQNEFKASPLLLSQSLIDGLVAIQLAGKVDYTISNHLWLVEYLQAGMILLGVEDAVPFLTTDIDKCIQIFSNAIEPLEENC